MAPRGKKFYKRKYRAQKNMSIGQRVSRTTLGDVWSAIKQIKNVINVEHKFVDVASSNSPTNTGSIIYLSGVTQGVTISNRVGNSIKLSSLLLRTRSVINASGSSVTIRYILFEDNDNQGATPAVTDLLASAATESALNITTYPGRFKILRDRTLNLSLNGNEEMQLQDYLPYLKHIKYSGTTNGVADQKTGALFLLVISSVATNAPTFVYNFRMRYVDN